MLRIFSYNVVLTTTFRVGTICREATTVGRPVWYLAARFEANFLFYLTRSEKTYLFLFLVKIYIVSVIIFIVAIIIIIIIIIIAIIIIIIIISLLNLDFSLLSN